MEGNQGKRAVLAFVGIAVLVIAVVGVSFAFFTYSRTGDGNNIITAGKIDPYLVLTDIAFPVNIINCNFDIICFTANCDIHF